MTNRVHIDAPAGIIDIEGEKDFVEGLLSKLFPLIEESRFGSKARTPNLPVDDLDDCDDVDKNLDTDAQNGKVKPRRKRSVAPKGHSCPDRIEALKGSGFFKDKKSVADVVQGLANNGFTHSTNQASAALDSMFKRSAIQRTKEGKGAWMYFWDRV